MGHGETNLRELAELAAKKSSWQFSVLSRQLTSSGEKYISEN